jgi:Arc/MetJ-type ribon-helix-helix transcriptional regulator
MASLKHEAIVRLFRNRPELAPELLHVLQVPLPAYTQTRIESAELTDIEPAEYRADTVVLLGDGKPDSKPVLGIIVEVQLSRKERKRFTWPAYMALLRARFECPTCVLVFTASESMATWCGRSIELGPSNVFTPLVVAPATMPLIDDQAAARCAPELAVLSCIAHGQDPDADAVARSAYATLLAVTELLSDDRQLLYHDLVSTALPEAARIALEKLMASGNYEFQSDFARKYLTKGREEGLEKGREEGLEKGLEKGREEGEVAGQAKALLAVLESRGMRISKKARTRILACTDIEQIDAWLRKAASVASVDELF